MKKSIFLALFVFLLIPSIFAFSGTWKDSSPITLTSGSIKYDIEGMNFVCESTPDFFNSVTYRKAPQGNFIQSCVGDPSKYNQYDKHFFGQLCTITTDESNNPSCWTTKINNIPVIYGETKIIDPFTTIQYTTNAEYSSIGIEPGYDINFDLNLDVKQGITLDMKIDQITDQSAKFTINYNNQMQDGLEGGIEVIQVNSIFLPNSRIATIPITFKRGSNSITYTLDKSLGNKEITAQAFVNVKQIQKGAIINEHNFVGNKYSTVTKVSIERSTAGTILFVPQGSTRLPNTVEKEGFFKRFIDWIKGAIPQ